MHRAFIYFDTLRAQEFKRSKINLKKKLFKIYFLKTFIQKK